MMTLSLCCIKMLLMVAIKPCDTSTPKQQLGRADMMVGVDVSHGSMSAMNIFFVPVMLHMIQVQGQMRYLISEANLVRFYL